jgi:hypothetical protein
MAPTFDSSDELLEWIKRIDSLVKVALEMGTPSHVLRHCSSYGVSEFWDDDKADDLAAKYDAYYCAELLGGSPIPTWDVPPLNLDKPPTAEAGVDGVQDFDFGDATTRVTTSDIMDVQSAMERYIARGVRRGDTIPLNSSPSFTFNTVTEES